MFKVINKLMAAGTEIDVPVKYLESHKSEELRLFSSEMG